jgi:hypothetical protein
MFKLFNIKINYSSNIDEKNFFIGVVFIHIFPRTLYRVT